MKVMSLFAGIGGFDLAAERMGWETSVQVEIDPWCQQVLAKNFPNAIRHDDIKTFDGTPYNGAIDLVCGGFPCQPYSNAGKQLGDQDERHLWPEMLRVIRQVAPRWVVGENVGGFLTWNGGLVFEQVHAELEAEGYEVQSFVLPACGVNAPHKRDRVWIVAYRHDRQRQSADQHLRTGRYAAGSGSNATSDTPNSYDWGYNTQSGSRQIQQSGIGAKSSDAGQPQSGRRNEQSSASTGEYRQSTRTAGGSDSMSAAYANGSRRRTQQSNVQPGQPNTNRGITANPRRARRQELDATKITERSGLGAGSNSSYWADWPTQPPVRTGNDGFSPGLDRNRTIKAAGNAVVWQVVYQIFKAIQQVESQFVP